MSENNVIHLAPRTRRSTRSKRKPQPPAGTPLNALISSWELALRSANKQPITIKLYLRTARLFAAFLEERELPSDAEGVTADEVRAFLVHERERAGLSTSASHHAYLGVFFNWLIAEEERSTFSPVLKADRPQLKRKAREYLTLAELGALLDVCKGSDFASRRDTAIIRIFIDNGMRVGGLSGLHLDDVDLRNRRLRIRLKGGDEHWAPIGAKTAQAIDRYLRVRARLAVAGLPWLWLGIKSGRHLTKSGVQEMLERRGAQAGVENVHPHRFRGTSAHEQLAAGAPPDVVRRVLGWKSEAMLRHYTEELAEERAREAHAQFSPSDRL
ncbi:tyrosine-type recombinase/integrase [Nonomuraea mangrovi]|uniref:Tyrosine-type recombinase/integrase n=1 Tax=Nonomuraea mangrovi TaxID=2316207 RepID=A0ABW4TGW6_9ACTN